MDRETTCGLLWWRPAWLQRFASHKLFVALYAIVGITQAITFSYVTVVLSTVERRFGLKSKEAAWIYSGKPEESGNELSQVLFIFTLPLVSRVERKPLYMGMALMLAVVGLFLMAVPNFIAPEYHERKTQLAQDNMSIALCNPNIETIDDCANKDIIGGDKDYSSLWFLFSGIFLVGIGGGFYYVFGYPYGDDNAGKESSPMMIGILSASRLMGPAIGFFVGAACLKVYVNPLEDTDLTEGDPEYVGAWWLGFPLIAVTLAIFTPWFIFFPRRLPKENTDAATLAKVATKEKEVLNQQEIISKSAKEQIVDMFAVYKRLLSNKLYFFNFLSLVTFFFGFIGYSTFLPKYIEYHFRQKASTSGSVAGVSKTVSGVIACLLSGWALAKFKVHARYVAMWNAGCNLAAVLGFVLFIFLSCPKIDLDVTSDGGIGTNCSEACRCDDSNFRPICAGDGRTFYSPCHAGCRVQDGDFFGDCQCIDRPLDGVEGRPVLLDVGYDAQEGLCPADCNVAFNTLLVVLFVSTFLGATARPANALMMLRAINPADKAASMSLVVSCVSLLGMLPAPIVYGHLMDQTCILWDEKCGTSRNCLIYDTDMMRYVLNGFTAFFVFLAFLCDSIVATYAKDLQLYDQATTDKQIEKLTMSDAIMLDIKAPNNEIM